MRPGSPAHYSRLIQIKAGSPDLRNTSGTSGPAAREALSELGELPGADITVHLARHGVQAQIERMVSAGLPVGEALLSRAADLGVDLIVTGAYGSFPRA